MFHLAFPVRAGRKLQDFARNLDKWHDLCKSLGEGEWFVPRHLAAKEILGPADHRGRSSFRQLPQVATRF